MTGSNDNLPPGQQLVAADKWPIIGERQPRFSPEPWAISIRGCVAHPRSFSLERLQAFPQHERVVDIHCVTRWSKLNVPFTGVRLVDVLETVQATEEARFLSFVARSERSHSTSLPIADICQLDPIIAFAAEGSPLHERHGGPARLVVPGRYFYKSVKWLEGIELLADDQLGFWESTAGYHNVADPWQEQRYIAANLDKTEVTRLLRSKDFSHRDLTSLVVSRLELVGLLAKSAILRNADFRGSQLADANFQDANLSNAHFEEADLQRANFGGADVEGANFAGADLRGADFSRASLFGASFVTQTLEAQLDTHTRLPAEALEQLTPEQRNWILAQR